MADICVLGLGYVGLPMASLLANAGFRVLGVDVDQRTVRALQSGVTRLTEAGLATLAAAAVNSGNLKSARAPEPSETFILCVPTPLTARNAGVSPAGVEAGGTPAVHKSVDLSAVEAASRTVVPCLRKGNLVILESTVPIGATRHIVGGILQAAGFEPGRDVHLCYCPERVLPGNTVAELIGNDRVIGGVTAACGRRAARVYERFCQGRITLTDDRTAEMCKLMENTCRDVNIALANSFARIAEEAGVNVWEALSLANLHPRVKILKPGPGAGGHCIPVDPWFLADAYPQHAALLRTAREINDTQPAHMLQRLQATGLLKSGSKLVVLGAAYKGDVDDARESAAVLLCRAAAAQGLETSVHDPLVSVGMHDGVEVGNDLAACLSGAAAAVLLTEHKFYREVPVPVFAEKMRGRLIGDTRNCLDHHALRQAGFTVVLLGDGRTLEAADGR